MHVDAEFDSHDSEGVVVGPDTGELNLNMNENILIIVSDFEGEKGAQGFSSKTKQKIYYLIKTKTILLLT